MHTHGFVPRPVEPHATIALRQQHQVSEQRDLRQSTQHQDAVSIIPDMYIYLTCVRLYREKRFVFVFFFFLSRKVSEFNAVQSGFVVLYFFCFDGNRFNLDFYALKPR